MVSRGVLFLFIWWILTNGAPSSWWIGIPAVLLALLVSIRTVPPIPFVWSAFFKFLPFFLLHSLLGGIDVARRAFQTRITIAPDFLDYPLRLPPGLPQVFMTNTVGLLPGTLGAELVGNVLKVHVLDGRKDFLPELRAVELGVARMFSIPVQDTGGDG